MFIPSLTACIRAPALFGILLLTLCACSTEKREQAKPNIILILADDLGHGDLGCYGSTVHRTPHLDRMAAEGIRFTDFYSSSGVCTPSRASLMTGCYPRRLNLHVDADGKWVLFPNAKKGLHPDEVTIAEILKGQGYATACVGKWHLGDQKEFLPTRQGFDTYFGIPYSNDMGRKGIPLPLMRDETVIEAPVEQSTLTQRYTREVLAFIEKHRDQPFFIYLPHTMPHVPLHASEAFRDKSANGKYGDAIEELDASTGDILRKLRDLGIDDQTLVIFSSDNGAALSPGGSNGPLKGAKGSTDEGGMRVPCIARWPARIPPGAVCREVAATIDMLPTLARLGGADIPGDRSIDGHDIRPLLMAEDGATSPHPAYYYYHTTQLQAVRSGKWKLVLPQAKKKIGWSKTEENTPALLYDLESDVAESADLAAQHPDIVRNLMEHAEQARLRLGDGDLAVPGQRKPGWVENPEPLLLE